MAPGCSPHTSAWAPQISQGLELESCLLLTEMRCRKAPSSGTRHGEQSRLPRGRPAPGGVHGRGVQQRPSPAADALSLAPEDKMKGPQTVCKAGRLPESSLKPFPAAPVPTASLPPGLPAHFSLLSVDTGASRAALTGPSAWPFPPASLTPAPAAGSGPSWGSWQPCAPAHRPVRWFPSCIFANSGAAPAHPARVHIYSVSSLLPVFTPCLCQY